MLSYTGPVYAEIGVAPNETQVERNEVFAQNDIVVGELPSGKIRIYTDRSHTTTIELDKQDCSIMRKEDNTLALGFKFGGLMWGFGPEIKIGHSSGVAWKGDVQRMVAEYQELCTQFNTGRLSQEEYKFEKKGIIQRGYGYAKELEKRFREKKNNMFREMDQGRYISLQNTRFHEGCCVTEGLPVSRHDEERKLLAEREHKIREREIALREKQLVEREKQIVAQVQIVQSRRQYKQLFPKPTHQIHSSSADFLRNRMATIRNFDRAFDNVIRSSRINSMNRDRPSNNVRWNIHMGGRW
jgi:hypothetical protein